MLNHPCGSVCLLSTANTLNANVKYMCEYEFQKNRDDAWFGFSSTAVVWTDKLCVSADEGPEAFVCVCFVYVPVKAIFLTALSRHYVSCSGTV